jgi:addiction module HigA family antidote
MPALVAGINVLRRARYKDADGRNKSGRDDPKGLNAMRTSSLSQKGLLPNSHPGQILVEEFLKPMKLSQTALARAIAVPPRRINEIVLGKRAITADTDLRLARYFNMSEGFFIGLQTDYELMERKRAIGDKLKAIRPRAS